MNKAVVILSGGIDSVTLAYDLYTRGYDLHMVHFYYGQKQADNERYCVESCAELLESELTIIDLVAAGLVLKPTEAGSTVVPNRNAIMLAIAYGIAATEGANLVAIGVQGGDFSMYPDCRPTFLRFFGRMETWALGNLVIELYVPFLFKSKFEVIQLGLGLGVPYEDTWTCYEGGEKPCGVCSACVDRLEAFASVGIEDPLEYTKQ